MHINSRRSRSDRHSTSSEGARNHKLESSKEVIDPCQKCPLLRYKARTCTTPEIIVGAPVRYIGEAPGREEMRRRRPFVGPTGRILNTIARKNGLLRGRDFSLINAVRCVNLNKPKPTAAAIKCCSYFFKADLRKASPKKVICLGASAYAALMGKSQGRVDKARGKITEIEI